MTHYLKSNFKIFRQQLLTWSQILYTKTFLLFYDLYSKNVVKLNKLCVKVNEEV